MQEDRWREFGEKGVWDIEVHIKALQPGEHGNLHRRKDLPARHLLRVRQRRIREEVALPDSVRGHASQGVPIRACCQPRGRPDRERFAPRHFRLRVRPRRQLIAAVQQLALRGHHLRFGLGIRVHDLLKRLHGPLGVEGVTGEVKTQDLPLVRLIRQRLRGRQALARLENVRAIMRRFPLLWPLFWDRAWRLGLLDGVRHHPRAGGGLTLCRDEAQGVACAIIKGARNGKAVLVLKISHRGFRLGPPHPVDAAGIMSGGFEPFLGACDLLLRWSALLGGERGTRADVLAHVYDDQPRDDTYANNNGKK